MSDLARFVAAAIEGSVVVDLLEENRVLTEEKRVLTKEKRVLTERLAITNYQHVVAIEDDNGVCFATAHLDHDGEDVLRGEGPPWRVTLTPMRNCPVAVDQLAATPARG